MADNQNGMAHFFLEGVEMHKSELHAVFRCFWEGKEKCSIGIPKGKNIKIKEYVHLTVVDIEKVPDQVVLVRDPPRSSAKVRLLMDGAPVPGYPEIMTVKEGQTLSVQSARRVLEVSGVKNVKRLS